MSAVTHADDTGPCRVVAPELEVLAAEHGDTLTAVKVDVEAAPEEDLGLVRPAAS